MPRRPIDHSWLKKGFFSSDRILVGQYVTVHGEVVSHVNISQVSVQDGGLYQCTATNRAGASQHSARLNIYGKLSNGLNAVFLSIFLPFLPFLSILSVFRPFSSVFVHYLIHFVQFVFNLCPICVQFLSILCPFSSITEILL